MTNKWTEEQLKAIETRGCNLLVAAAAGSGKTAVLVERIIKMITEGENPVDIDRLLVVTFTNAAASEMRERIGDAISKELEKKPNSKILQKQMALLNKSNITTMHSFCLGVIKNNFHLIDLDPGFRIGDQTECNLIKTDILMELFEDKYSEEDEEFLNLVETYGENKGDTRLQDMILSLYHFSMSGPWPEKWLMNQAEEFNISSVLELNNKAWSKVLIDSIKIDVESFKQRILDAIDICANTTGLEPYMINLQEDLEQIKEVEENLNDGLDKIYNSLKLINFSTLKRVSKKDVQDISLQEDVKSLRDGVKKDLGKLRDDVFSISPEETVLGMKKMYPNIKALCNLVIEFSHRYTVEKRTKGILDFNDLEHLCLKILIDYDEDGDIKPSKVAENFREKFEEVLVDEYQDSNNVQEAIIDLVSRKSLENPNVFMVGDVKQSIYRFRQAKPELFLQKYNSYSTIDEAGNQKITLYKNFRSREEVINAVNYIFFSLMSETVGELKYDEDEALNLGADYKKIEEINVFKEQIDDLQNVETGGVAEIHILNKEGINKRKDNKEKEDNNESISIEDDEDLDSIQLEGRIIAKRIESLMDDSSGKCYMVWDKSLNCYRKIRYKDIVILLRATKSWSDVLVDELGNRGIPVYADTGTGYFQTVEVRTIMALLHIIDNPMQDIYVLSALRAPIFSFTAEELADLRLLNKEKYFYENIKDIVEGTYDATLDTIFIDKCIYFYKSLQKWREKAKYMPIDEFIWYLYIDTSYYGYVGAMPNGVQRQANLRILFQRAKQYEKTSFKGLFNFINFINKLKKSSGDIGSAKILGENEDVVRIMSIHKSKGLEFPVVFLSGTGKQFNLMDLRGSLLFHEELGIGADCIDVNKRISYPTLQKHAIKKKFEFETLSEEMRILYVALTRAKEKLIITGAVSDFEKTFKKWCKAAGMAKESKIQDTNVLKSKTYIEWIGMALAKHRDGEKIRDIGCEDITINLYDPSKWHIEVWHKSDLINHEVIEEEKVQENSLFYLVNNKDISKEIEKRLSFSYKFKESTTLPSNISVSDLKRADLEQDSEQTVSLFKAEIKKKPKFMMEKRGLSASEKGTLMHFVMQHLNLSLVNNVEEINKQIADMNNKELLDAEQKRAINVYKIYKFFKDDLGIRMLNAYENNRMIKRELPFFTYIESSKIVPNINDDHENERLRMQGVIDCFFEEEGDLVILDYKTDYVEEGNKDTLLKKYKTQIDLYSETLEKITGKKVKEKYLYSFSLNKSIKY